MKVSTLIQKLQKLDPEAIMVRGDSEFGAFKCEEVLHFKDYIVSAREWKKPDIKLFNVVVIE